MTESESLSVRQVGEILGISYNNSYALFVSGHFPTYIQKRKRMVDSADFEAWYRTQNKYRKITDLSLEERKRKYRNMAIKEMPRLAVSEDKTVYSVNELVILLDISLHEVRELIWSGIIPSFKVDHKYQIRREYIIGWLNEQRLILEEAEQNGNHQTAGQKI